MCGIAGKLPKAEPELLQRMADALEHRGPDARGVHCEEGIGLAMRRLAVIDTEHGEQPLYSEDGQIVLVANGEIYNHVELRRELEGRGHRFHGGSDIETIVHLYEEEGAACVQRLRGMFAFALWDKRKRELLLVRDRIGKKPLYWCLREDVMRFASEPRAILMDPEVPRDVDPRAIDAFLVNQYVPNHLCAFAVLRKLPPASILRWRPGGLPVIERYWQLDYTPKRFLGLEEASAELRELLLEATRLRLRSDVPLGAFLSGGLDSSVVVAAMAQVSSTPVKTFTIAFPGDAVDECAHARRVAEHLGTDHHEVEVAPLDVALLPRVAWHFGEPFADPAALATFQLSELTRRQVTVALNGDGGDESFAGYRRYRHLLRTRPAELVPLAARRALATALARAAGTTEGRTVLPRAARLARRAALEPALRYADLMRYFSTDDRAAVYGPMLADTLQPDRSLAHVERVWKESAGLHWTDRVMAVDLETYLSDDLVAKVDITSMAHGLEVRSPLLDQELVTWAAQLDVALKAQGEQDKIVLRHAAREWLPQQILERPKQGLEIPVARWLRGELWDTARELLLDKASRDRGVFKPDGVQRMLDQHREGLDRGHQLWAMMSLELWFRTCVDSVTATPDALPVLA